MEWRISILFLISPNLELLSGITRSISFSRPRAEGIWSTTSPISDLRQLLRMNCCFIFSAYLRIIDESVLTLSLRCTLAVVCKLPTNWGLAGNDSRSPIVAAVDLGFLLNCTFGSVCMSLRHCVRLAMLWLWLIVCWTPRELPWH